MNNLPPMTERYQLPTEGVPSIGRGTKGLLLGFPNGALRDVRSERVAEARIRLTRIQSADDVARLDAGRRLIYRRRLAIAKLALITEMRRCLNEFGIRIDENGHPELITSRWA